MDAVRRNGVERAQIGEDLTKGDHGEYEGKTTADTRKKC